MVIQDKLSVACRTLPPRSYSAHLYNLTKDQAMAEDMAQEAFLRAYNKLSQYNPKYAFSQLGFIRLPTIWLIVT